MTTQKKISYTLANMLDNPIVKTILDRKSNISEVIDEVQSWWSYDIFTRKPSPAYTEDGIFQGTDLDLACFMYSLSGRGAIINIPYYKSHTQHKIREDQEIKSTANRHGVLLGVGGNKDFFSFNISINDLNVISDDQIGFRRSFSLTNKNGDWYEGWNTIQFDPTKNENKFITENQLWTGNRIIFKNFIHPNRWVSFFGQYYVITKMLIERLGDQCAFMNTEVKRIQAAGISFPEGKGPQSASYEYGDSKQEKFTAFNAKIYIPKTEIQGDYEFYPMTQKGLIEAYDTRKRLLYGVIPSLRFMTRATEYAHFKAPDRFPAWMKNLKWEPNFVEPGKRTKWERLKLFQTDVGEYSISILKRTFEKSASVADD